MRQKPGGGKLGTADEAEAAGGGCGGGKARAVCKDRRASLWGEGKRERELLR